jgi:hypothetical protein
LLDRPDFNLACGMSEVETKGYFDVSNAQPWDTWLVLLDAPDAKHWKTSLMRGFRQCSCRWFRRVST